MEFALHVAPRDVGESSEGKAEMCRGEGKGRGKGRVNGRGEGEVAVGVYVTQATLVRASTATRVTRQRRMKEAA